MRAFAFSLAILVAPAAANVIAVASGDDGAQIRLHDNDANICVDGARFAQWVGKDGKAIGGCWKLIPGGRVGVAFFDGDAGAIPVAMLREPKAT